MRVMALGDTHGDTKWCVEATRIAGEYGVERILQVGDFGYWPKIAVDTNLSLAQWLVNEISWACHEYGVAEWIVIEGNHDDHEALRAHEAIEALAGSPDPDGMVPLHPLIRYSPRGNSFTLAGTTFGTLGGAASIDAYLERAGVEFGPEPYREGYDWFPELERPTLDDVERLPSSVDVLLTHEAPIEVDLSKFNGFPNIYISPEIQEITDAARHIVSAAAYKTKPKLLVHGHWHGRNRVHARWGDSDCEIIGLASNNRRAGRDARAYLILDLPDLTIKTVKSGL